MTHENYDKLTAPLRRDVDRAYVAMAEALKESGLALYGADRAERVVDAIAKYVLECKEPQKHTDGPWRASTVRYEQGLHHGVVSSAKGSNPAMVIAVTGVVGAGDDAESIANAALISAAPDMFYALTRCVNALAKLPVPETSTEGQARISAARMLGVESIKKANPHYYGGA